MGPIDFVVIAVIALIVGGASFYIYRAKKSGKKCIGCPDSASCQSGSKCSGSCSSCSCGCSSKEEN
ncbi:MAG: FeoB-associated Cys-rich membrane protein [Clostridia bacterium]|nr:FeoB-associated Cys-rich membrane protein [Clostridia bacterium]